MEAASVNPNIRIDEDNNHSPRSSKFSHNLKPQINSLMQSVKFAQKKKALKNRNSMQGDYASMSVARDYDSPSRH